MDQRTVSILPVWQVYCAHDEYNHRVVHVTYSYEHARAYARKMKAETGWFYYVKAV